MVGVILHRHRNSFTNILVILIIIDPKPKRLVLGGDIGGFVGEVGVAGITGKFDDSVPICVNGYVNWD